VFFKDRYPLITVGKPLMFYPFAKEDVSPDRAQSKGDRVKDQPEDDVFRRYFGPVFL